VGDYIHSIGRLAKEIYPGHGTISENPDEDMEKALQNAKELLREVNGAELVHKKFPLALKAGTT
jgi:hypothetical protein